MRFLLEAEPTQSNFERTNPLHKLAKNQSDDLTATEEKAHDKFEREETQKNKKQRHQEVQNLFYKAKNASQKKDLIDEWIETHPNYDKIKNASDTIELSILENDGIYESDNPFIGYINKIKFDLYNEQANLIYQLTKQNKIDLSQPWLYDKELYKPEFGSTDNSLYKLKAFAFVSNPEISSRYGDSNTLTVKDLYDENGKVKDVKAIRELLNKFQTKTPENKKTNSATEFKAEENIQNPNIQTAAQALKAFGLKEKEIADALSSVDILPEETAEQYIFRLFKSLGK